MFFLLKHAPFRCVLMKCRHFVFPRISAELLGQRMINDIDGPYKCAMNYELHKFVILPSPCKCANGSRVTSPRDGRVRFFFFYYKAYVFLHVSELVVVTNSLLM